MICRIGIRPGSKEKLQASVIAVPCGEMKWGGPNHVLVRQVHVHTSHR